jgi:hypothetical protein
MSIVTRPHSGKAGHHRCEDEPGRVDMASAIETLQIFVTSRVSEQEL